MPFYTHCQSCGKERVARLGSGREARGSYEPYCPSCMLAMEQAQGTYCRICGRATLDGSPRCSECDAIHQLLGPV